MPCPLANNDGLLAAWSITMDYPGHQEKINDYFDGKQITFCAQFTQRQPDQKLISAPAIEADEQTLEQEQYKVKVNFLNASMHDIILS